MAILEFTIKLAAKPADLFKLIIDYENLPSLLPDQLKNVAILEKEDDYTITEETLLFSSLIKKTIIQKTKHQIISENNLKSEILSGPAKGSKISVELRKNGEETLIIVLIDLKLGLKTKIFSPIIKKWYKSMLTGIFYKMNTLILNSET